MELPAARVRRKLKSAVKRVSPSRKQVAPSRPLNGDEMKWTAKHLLIDERVRGERCTCSYFYFLRNENDNTERLFVDFM